MLTSRSFSPHRDWRAGECGLLVPSADARTPTAALQQERGRPWERPSEKHSRESRFACGMPRLDNNVLHTTNITSPIPGELIFALSNDLKFKVEAYQFLSSYATVCVILKI